MEYNWHQAAKTQKEIDRGLKSELVRNRSSDGWICVQTWAWAGWKLREEKERIS